MCSGRVVLVKRLENFYNGKSIFVLKFQCIVACTTEEQMAFKAAVVLEEDRVERDSSEFRDRSKVSKAGRSVELGNNPRVKFLALELPFWKFHVFPFPERPRLQVVFFHEFLTAFWGWSSRGGEHGRSRLERSEENALKHLLRQAYCQMWQELSEKGRTWRPQLLVFSSHHSLSKTKVPPM